MNAPVIVAAHAPAVLAVTSTTSATTASAPRAQLSRALADCIAVTRRSDLLQGYADNYADIMLAVLGGAELRSAVVKGGQQLGIDVARSARGGDPMTACYITSGKPAYHGGIC
eukprot:8150-Heterococcus_DN1.PRE.2